MFTEVSSFSDARDGSLVLLVCSENSAQYRQCDGTKRLTAVHSSASTPLRASPLETLQRIAGRCTGLRPQSARPRSPAPAPPRRPPALPPSAPPAALQPAAAAAPAGPALPAPPPRGRPRRAARPAAGEGPGRGLRRCPTRCRARPAFSAPPPPGGGGRSRRGGRGTALAVPGPRALSAGRRRPRCRRPRGGRGRRPVAPRRWRAAASGAGCPLAGVRAPEWAGSGDRAWPGGGRCRA